MREVWNVKVRVMNTSKTMCTCPFMSSSNPRHKGADLIPASTSETPEVLAFADGTVIAVGNVRGTNSSTGTAGCGTYVAIRHTGNIVTRYQHLKYNSLRVKKGQTVKKGQSLGLYGRPSTGHSSGPHLHWDISLPKKPAERYVSGTFCGETRYYVNPKPYLLGEKTLTDTGTRKKVKADLNIRRGPGTQYGVVGEYKAGTIVTVYAMKNGWAKVSKDEERWVAGNYLISI